MLLKILKNHIMFLEEILMLLKIYDVTELGNDVDETGCIV